MYFLLNWIVEYSIYVIVAAISYDLYRKQRENVEMQNSIRKRNEEIEIMHRNELDRILDENRLLQNLLLNEKRKNQTIAIEYKEKKKSEEARLREFEKKLRSREQELERTAVRLQDAALELQNARDRAIVRKNEEDKFMRITKRVDGVVSVFAKVATVGLMAFLSFRK